MRSALSGMVLAVLIGCAAPVRAGLYNTAEPPVSPSGDIVRFLGNDGELVRLRNYGPSSLTSAQVSKEREDYLHKVERLRGQGRLSIQDQANLGAYLIRLRKTNPLGRDFEEALQVLEAARREEPRNFYVLANLGTVYQLSGQLDAALSCLQEAHQLAPEPLRVFERYHLQLVLRRSREQLRLGMAPLDELFPVRFVGPSGQWEPGVMSDQEKKKLPPNAHTIVQQLLVWLPEDGRLHWLLGELANAQGDVAGAYKAMDSAVFDFRLSVPELKERRQRLKEVADKLPRRSKFEGLGSFAGAEAEPVEYAWQLGWRGWTAIGVAAVLSLGLIALQFRELRRRRLKG